MPSLKRRKAKPQNAQLSKNLGSDSNDLPVVEVSFDLIKSKYFRTIHVDGAFGGISPTGTYLRMGIFNESQPIPEKITHSLTPDNQLGPENIEKRLVNHSFIREVEADLIMNFETAKLLKNWLEQQLSMFEQMNLSRGLEGKKNV